MATSEKKIIKLKGPGWRASFAHVYEARAIEDGKPKRFSCDVLGDQSNPKIAAQIVELKNEAARVAKEEFGDDVKLKDLELCWGVRDAEDEICPGWFFLKMWCSEKDRPLIVNRAGQPTVAGDPESIYAGCQVNTNPTFFAWTYRNKDGKVMKRGVSANLRSVQFVDDDKPFGRPPLNADDEFEALGDAANKASGEGAAKDPFE